VERTSRPRRAIRPLHPLVGRLFFSGCDFVSRSTAFLELLAADARTGLVPADCLFGSTWFRRMQQLLEIRNVLWFSGLDAGDHLPAMCIADGYDFFKCMGSHLDL
jgi:hypothetical protein